MSNETVFLGAAVDEAFAAYVQALETGETEVARQLLREHSGLAEVVALHDALCARVPLPWATRADTNSARMLGDFELLRELGHGGEGVVYQARQRSLQRLVAVKEMRHERFTGRHDVERFRRDSTILASLRHPNIVEIYFAGESELGP